jgi:type IV secretory pathway TrbD component
MRGSIRQTNKALSAPILLMGAERSLVILLCFFWGWVFIGIMPHWPIVIVALSFVCGLYALRFAAQCDPQGVAVFRANSRFLLQNRFYCARGFAGNLQKTKKIRTVPVHILARI